MSGSLGSDRDSRLVATGTKVTHIHWELIDATCGTPWINQLELNQPLQVSVHGCMIKEYSMDQNSRE